MYGVRPQHANDLRRAFSSSFFCFFLTFSSVHLACPPAFYDVVDGTPWFARRRLLRWSRMHLRVSKQAHLRRHKIVVARYNAPRTSLGVRVSRRPPGSGVSQIVNAHVNGRFYRTLTTLYSIYAQPQATCVQASCLYVCISDSICSIAPVSSSVCASCIWRLSTLLMRGSRISSAAAVEGGRATSIARSMETVESRTAVSRVGSTPPSHLCEKEALSVSGVHRGICNELTTSIITSYHNLNILLHEHVVMRSCILKGRCMLPLWNLVCAPI